VFVGEAAGVDRTTGEGIAQALVFGALAGEAIAESLAKGGGAVADLRGYDARVRGSLLGRHLLESAVLASLVFGRRGRPFRRLLEDSDRARRAGAAWYAGERLGRGEKLSLAALLARAAFDEVSERGARGASFGG
jgi:menaquinone-9 beta-reductase